MKGSQIKLENRNNYDDDDDDDDLMQDNLVNVDEDNLDIDDNNGDIYGNTRDTPFTPFAEKSSIFSEVMGNTEELFKNLQYPMSGDPTQYKVKNDKVKQRLNFGDDKNKNIKKEDDDDLYRRPIIHTFEIKWRSDDDFRSQDPRYIDIEATRMDVAVQQFAESHQNYKIMTVKLKQMGY